MLTASDGPRRFLVDPEQFGKLRGAKWYAGTRDPRERRELAAAYFQHQTVYSANRRLAELGYKGNLTKFANDLDCESSGLRKKFRGSSPAQMEDYLAWAYLLGRRIIPEANAIYKDGRAAIFVPRHLRQHADK